MQEGEAFVGGFAGGFLARGASTGYGIYATTRRIIGVNVVKVGARSFLGGAMAGLVKGELLPKLTPAESAAVVTELDAKKDFDVSKDQVSRIELKGPGLFGSGHLVISTLAGEETRIRLVHKVAFERLRDLMQVFDPDVLTLV
ncbi:MAG TPA: hypothetical protein VET82_04545 [Candidatus Eisenbacteria bacterium]|nr:hypothetical protein [Candidatus Eisenbacteria bacterium]